MAKYRETPCKYYLALGQCTKGHDACHRTYCQHCGKYEPRAKMRHINKKKQYNQKIRRPVKAMRIFLFYLHSQRKVIHSVWPHSQAFTPPT